MIDHLAEIISLTNEQQNIDTNQPSQTTTEQKAQDVIDPTSQSQNIETIITDNQSIKSNKSNSQQNKTLPSKVNSITPEQQPQTQIAQSNSPSPPEINETVTNDNEITIEKMEQSLNEIRFRI